MSTSTLLLCATWLRQSSHGRSAWTAPPDFTPFLGRGRVPRSVGHSLTVLSAIPFLSGSAALAQDRADRRPSIDLARAEVRADPPPPANPPVRIGGTPPAPCVQVDIAGYRVGHLDCASQALQAAARVAQAQAGSGFDPPVIEAGSPDVRVGVSSLSGSRLRMGNALGNSVHPQRPSRATSPPRPGRRP